ncbi:hypothetical protein Tco_0269459 [Tanacetum coccineum]
MTLRDPKKVPLKISRCRFYVILLSDLSFSGGGDDEEVGDVEADLSVSQIASVFSALWDWFIGTGKDVSAGSSLGSSSFIFQIGVSNLQPGDGLWFEWHQQIEADPSLVPLAPHQKLTGISMARKTI